MIMVMIVMVAKPCEKIVNPRAQIQKSELFFFSMMIMVMKMIIK